jgi:hypothetical protein
MINTNTLCLLVKGKLLISRLLIKLAKRQPNLQSCRCMIQKKDPLYESTKSSNPEVTFHNFDHSKIEDMHIIPNPHILCYSHIYLGT